MWKREKGVTEKVKARGFFGSKGSKGKSKGKFKGGFKNRFRKPLAQRILESTCRICNQPGNWKAECPQRAKSNAPGTNNTAFAGMTVFSTMAHSPPYDLAPEDVDAPPPEATAFTMEETCLMTAMYHVKGPQHDHRGHLMLMSSRGCYPNVSQPFLPAFHTCAGVDRKVRKVGFNLRPP